MIIKVFKFISCIFFVMFYHISHSVAQPNWKVNHNQFEYNMTVTCVAILPCNKTLDVHDQVAAFVNGELRGVGNFNVIDEGIYYCFLTIYDTLYSGSEVSFKLYDASEDKIFDALEKTNFVDNKILGSISNPFLFHTEESLKSLEIDLDSIPNSQAVGFTCASLSLHDLNNEKVIAIFNFVNDSLGEDNEMFDISGNELILLKDLKKINKARIQIHLQGTNENDCSIDRIFILPIINTNVGIKVISNQIFATCYPNPSTNEFNFLLSNIELSNSIEVVNANGIIIEKLIPNNSQIKFGSNYPNGIYWVKANIGKELKAMKLIKQN